MISIDILLVTHNQEQYIQQALDGILMQRVNPDVQVRIIVADDCSKDNTLAYIRRTLGAKAKLASGNEAEVVYLSVEHNLGIAGNYKRAIAATTGDYVAVLEGDDYWIDPFRITKHIVCFAQNNEIQYTKNEYLVYLEDKGSYHREHYTDDNYFFLQDVIRNNGMTGNLSSCVFRGKSMRDLPQEVYDTQLGGWIDWNVGVGLLKHGVGYYMTEIMSVYRLNTGKNVSRESVSAKEEQEQYRYRAIAALNIAGIEWAPLFEEVIRNKQKEIQENQCYTRYVRWADYISPCISKFIFIDLPKIKPILRTLIPNKLYRLLKNKFRVI